MHTNTDNNETDFFSVSYSIIPQNGRSVEQTAQDIAEEQTVEIPHEHIPQSHFDQGIVGNVIEANTLDDGTWRAVIRYRNDVAGISLPQFLNVLFGNISIQKGIAITGLNLSETFLSHFAGPRSGIDGIRKQLGMYGRPLLCTALKPMGSSGCELAQIAGACARGGIDLIKDDHGIADQHFHPFEERIGRVAEAIAAANAHTGGQTLYFPNICASVDDIERQVEFAVKNGIRGVLLSPMLVGFDTARYLAGKYQVSIMAHPAFSGSLYTSSHQGISPEVILGTIFRIAGADISVFPSWGGRFPFTRNECAAISEALTGDLGSLKSAFPAPAGGIQPGRFDAIAQTYGKDAVWLVGGALLGHSDDLQTTTEHFLDTLRTYFDEEHHTPDAGFVSSCEIGGADQQKHLLKDVLAFDNYTWKGRNIEHYKPEGSAVFGGVHRIELAGKTGTNTAFDLRYFEIEPGGFSTLEKHVHEHVIIGVRGSGTLVKKNGRHTINPHDIAYVGPLEPHQLCNVTSEPFGFYCIVDHRRDRPQSLDVT
jgi:ribulose-bisphosphate carboxylase large chain